MTTDRNGYPTWLHTAPASQGAFNAIRRARQLTDFHWSPSASGKIKNLHYLQSASYEATQTLGVRETDKYFNPAVDYTGFPYGNHGPRSANMVGVGTTYGLETVATAFANPESVEYYESATIRDYGASCYGSVCSNLVAYAMGFPYLTTGTLVNVPGFNLLYALVTDGVRHDIDDLQLADVLLIDGHCCMVTDLIKQGGHVVNVEICEATMYAPTSKCWRRMWDLDGFFTWYSGFSVYRYAYIDSVPYTPNRFSPMPDEGQPNQFTDFRVLPYEGNRFIYEASATMKLIVHNAISLGELAYTHVLVEKNGAQFGDLIQIDTTKGTDYYQTGEITLASDEAEYTAALVTVESNEITKKSTPCTWYAIAARNPTITFASGTLTIVTTVKAPGFVPAFTIGGWMHSGSLRFSNSYTSKIMPDMMTAAENQDGSITYTITKTGITQNYIAVKVGYTNPDAGTWIETYNIS